MEAHGSRLVSPCCSVKRRVSSREMGVWRCSGDRSRLYRKPGAVALQVRQEAFTIRSVHRGHVDLRVREHDRVQPRPEWRRGTRRAVRREHGDTPGAALRGGLADGALIAAARRRWTTPAARKRPPWVNNWSTSTPSPSSTCMPSAKVAMTPQRWARTRLPSVNVLSGVRTDRGRPPSGPRCVRRRCSCSRGCRPRLWRPCRLRCCRGLGDKRQSDARRRSSLLELALMRA